MKDNRHDDFDFEAEAERVHKKLSKIHDAQVKNSHMKYEKGLSNLDKYCKNYMKSEFDKSDTKIANRLEVLQVKLDKFDKKD